MTGLVSFSLFGKDNIYLLGALRNAQMYIEWQPSWRLRFYCGESVPWDVKQALKVLNAEIIEMDDPEDQTATFWRFLALKGGGYNFYLFRDCDSRPIKREQLAVEQWLDSDRGFHVMRDHPWHNVPMLAGLWGVKSTHIHKIRHKIPQRIYGDHYQVDQRFLRYNLWRYVRRSLMAHSEQVEGDWDKIEDRFKFPSKRHGKEFVGEGFLANNQPRFPKHREYLV